MDLSRIRPTTVALAISAGLIALVGTYTENSGFQWAGVIVGIVVAITAINEATTRDDSSQEKDK